MKGDFTRITFNPADHYTQVLKQQGRVDLDADWNEAEAIHQHLLEQGLGDAVGASGAPLQAAGFRITPVGGGGDLGVGPGRFYLAGRVAENNSPTTLNGQPFGSLETLTPPAVGGAAVDALIRADLVYLDVWQQHITSLEEPRLREEALGGPDTTTRLATLWRVRVRPGVAADDCNDAIANFPPPTLGGSRLTNGGDTGSLPTDPCLIPPDANGYRGLENRLYRVEVDAVAAPNGPRCKWSQDNGAVVFAVEEVITPTRVRLKRQGKDAYLRLADGDLVEVVSGQDEVLGRPGILTKVKGAPNGLEVELEDDISLYQPSPISPFNPPASDLKLRRWNGVFPINGAEHDLGDSGIRVKVEGTNHRSGDFWVFAARTISGDFERLSAAPPQGVEHRCARLALIQWRRRSQRFLLRPTIAGFAPDLAVTWSASADRKTWEFQLEPNVTPAVTTLVNRLRANGSAISFFVNATGQTATTTRPATIRVTLSAPNPQFLNQVAALALETGIDQVLPTILDCRRIFRPLTELLELLYVSGDGQETRPGQPLPQPLMVRVSRGGEPAPGVAVDFSVSLGGGQLQANSATGAALSVLTDVDGLAQARWTLDAVAESQQVIARLQADPRLQVRFNANLEREEARPVILVKELFWNIQQPEQAIHDRPVDVKLFATDLNVACSEPVAPDSVGPGSCFMTLEMPNASRVGRAAFYQPIVLAALAQSDPARGLIRWTPTAEARAILQEALQLFHRQKDTRPGILARFTLKGNFIRHLDIPDVYLDGESFGTKDGETPTNLRLPSGDRRPGGDFEAWFWLTGEVEAPQEEIGFVPSRPSSPDLPRLRAALNFAFDRSVLAPGGITPPGYAPRTNLVFNRQQALIAMRGALANADLNDLVVIAPESLAKLGQFLDDHWRPLFRNFRQDPSGRLQIVPDDALINEAIPNGDKGQMTIVIARRSMVEAMTQIGGVYKMDDFEVV